MRIFSKTAWLCERWVFKKLRTFNYSKIKEEKWDSEILGLVAAIYKFAGKQELYLKQRPDELEKLVEIAKIQSTEASNAIEGIVTTNTRIKQLVEEKTTPRNRDEEEIAGYRDVLNIIHESFDAIPITQNYILQLHKILCSRHIQNGKDILQQDNEKNFLQTEFLSMPKLRLSGQEKMHCLQFPFLQYH